MKQNQAGSRGRHIFRNIKIEDNQPWAYYKGYGYRIKQHRNDSGFFDVTYKKPNGGQNTREVYVSSHMLFWVRHEARGYIRKEIKNIKQKSKTSLKSWP